MKSIKVVAVALLLLLIGVTVLSAQSDSDVVSVNYTVVRVLESPFGYSLILRGSDLVEREFLVPTRWIYTDKVALVSFSDSAAAPYLQGYFGSQSGELRFVRLVLPRNADHPVWSYDVEEGLEERFQAASLGSL